MPHDVAQQTDAPAVNPDGTRGLSTIEREVIEHFAEISRALGQPRSLAEIYGLLFISSGPLAMDDLMVRLKISKGSASQGLRFLRNIDAIRPVEMDGDRRTHYIAVAELRRLAGRFLEDQLAPRVAGNSQRLKTLLEEIVFLPEAERTHVAKRIKLLQSWNKNTRRIIPLVLRLLGN